MPRAARPLSKPRHDPLHVQIDNDKVTSTPTRRLIRRQKSHRNSLSDENQILDIRTTRKILELATDQQAEIESDDSEIAAAADEHDMQLRDPAIFSEDEDEDDTNDPSDPGHDVSEAEAYAELQLAESDVDALNRLLPPSSVSRKTLADIIFSKMDGEPSQALEKSDIADPYAVLDPKIVELYTKVGLAMRGKGPLVKPMKILPTLSQWAPCLSLTNPEQWSPTHVAWPQSMKPEQARIYLHFVLLNAVRTDIADNNKLNVHYYEALIRAMYKPAAFFKGIVFPLLETGCNLKEAAIIASVLAKKTIPSVHLGAAIINIAKSDFSGPRALFLRVLIDKKKDLPYKVIDELVFHFIRVSNSRKSNGHRDTERLPVLWHQSLLSFCQRYASNLTADQKDALLDVVRANPHHQIGPEVRRELTSSSVRGPTDIMMS